MKAARPLTVVALALGMGCAPDDYREPAEPGAASLRVHVSSTGSVRAGQRRYGIGAGQNVASQLLGLKYYFRSLLICQGLRTEGTAFYDPTNCLEIYRGQPDPDFEYADPNADLSAHADLARRDDAGFVDIASPDGCAKLARTLTLGPDAAGSYEWGVATWYLPIKVTAEIPLGGDAMLHTHDGETQSFAVGAGYAYLTTSPADFSDDSPAEEAVVLHANGGSWFRFQSPFIITPEDIDARERFALDLVFNPEGLLKGYAAEGEGLNLLDSVGHGIAVPMLDLTPVPRQSGSFVRVESYRATIEAASEVLEVPNDHLDLRLEIYSIADDPEGRIYGASLTTHVNDLTATVLPQAPKIAFVLQAQDGSLSFKDWAQAPILSGFIRQAEAGDWTEAWLSCGETGMRFAGCGDHLQSPGGRVVYFYLESVRTLP